MLRRRWIGMLVLCLAVAGLFAWLGQWQLERAIETDPPPPGVTEQVAPLTEVLEPGEYLPEPLVGQKVETSGSWVSDDFLIVSSRYNDGVEGYWVTGQLRVAERTSIAVAIGWTADRAVADAAVEQLEADADGSVVDVAGRIISDEGPSVPPKTEPQQMDRMSPAALLSRWHDVEQLDVYRPYLASTGASAGLDDISSRAPDELSSVNWLNVFYAVEWAIFAGFAFYLWYRLAKDAWERELEEFDDAAAGSEAS
nr:SURF1 family cytochrome oxidase biogenesis protein [uncultured Microbacterium sp.]